MSGTIRREFGIYHKSKLTTKQTDGVKDQLTILELPNGFDLFINKILCALKFNILKNNISYAYLQLLTNISLNWLIKVD